jgi:hypothetical protein
MKNNTQQLGLMDYLSFRLLLAHLLIMIIIAISIYFDINVNIIGVELIFANISMISYIVTSWQGK